MEISVSATMCFLCEESVTFIGREFYKVPLH